MQPQNAQGIGGVMSNPQQAQPQSQFVPAPQPQVPMSAPQQAQMQPQPTPQSGSPMAGLGSVQERVNAYRGNPAPLQQRYAVSQDLLDLLALQKIKSEKESAARQMQLQMGQQQAAQGMGPMTVAQQREQEVMELTKRELAQQRSKLAQQQTTEQQEAMQKLLQGIASAPGAATAAQPQMMAAGGIVGYADGGGIEDEEQTSPAGRLFSKVMGADKERIERVMLRDKIIDKYRPKAGPVGLFIPQSDAQRAQAKQIMDRLDSMSTAEMRALLEQPAGAGRGMVNPPMVDPNAPMSSPQAAPGGMPGAQGVAPTPRPTPTPRPAPAGLAGLPGAQGSLAAPRPAIPQQPGAAPAAPGFEGDIKNAILGAVNADPMAGGAAYGKSVQERLMFPEEQERRRAAIAEQRKLYEQEFDPERQRQEKLQRFLLGMSGRRYGEFAGGAGAAIDYATSQRAAQRERLKGLEDMEQGLFSLRQGATEKGIGAESKLMGELRDQQRAGLGAGVQQLSTEERAKTSAADRSSRERMAALDREIARAKIAAERERTAVDKSAADYSRLEGNKQRYYQLISAYEKAVIGQYETQLGALQMQLNSSDPEKRKAAQSELRNIKLQIDAEVATKTKPLQDELDKLSAMQGGYPTSGSGANTGFKIVGVTPSR